MEKFVIISSQAFSLVNFRGDLIKRLKEEGFEVFALAPDFNDEIRFKIQELGARSIDIKMSRTGLNPFMDLISLLDLTKKLRSIKPKYMLVYFIKPLIYGNIAGWLAGVPKIFSMVEGLGVIFAQNRNNFTSYLSKNFTLFLYKISLRFSCKVIFLNDSDSSKFLDLKIVNNKQLVILGGIGVDLNKWKFSTVPTKKITFALAARLLKEKGVLEFVEAAKYLKSKGENVRFLILGDLDENPSSIARNDLDDWVKNKIVEWPGHVELDEWLDEVSVFVLPTYYGEGVPRSIQEAMAKGRPIITTNIPGCRDCVINNVNGLLINPQDKQELIKSMMFFINNPEKISLMGLKSRKIAEEKFDVKIVNARLIKIFI